MPAADLAVVGGLVSGNVIAVMRSRLAPYTDAEAFEGEAEEQDEVAYKDVV